VGCFSKKYKGIGSVPGLTGGLLLLGVELFEVEQVIGVQSPVLDDLVAGACASAEQEDRGEVGLHNFKRSAQDSKRFSTLFQDETAHQLGVQGRHSRQHFFEQCDVALAQGLDQKLRRDRLGLLKFLGELLRFAERRIVYDSRVVGATPQYVVNRILDLIVKFGFIDPVMLDNMFAQSCRNPPVDAFSEVRPKIATIDQRDLNVVDVFRLLDKVSHR
jgi:hypothetical protein